MKRVELSHVRLDAALFVPDYFKNICPIDDVLQGEYDFMLVGNDLRILDAGGFVGDFAIWAAHRFPGSDTVSYEPNKDAYDCMVLNTEKFKVEAHNKALSSIGEKLTLSFSKEHMGQGSVVGEHQASGETIEQEVLSDRPQDLGKFDVVKVDTEGAELDILRNLDLSETSAVMYEVHSESDRVELEELMKEREFVVRGYRRGIDGVGVWCWTKEEVPMYYGEKAGKLSSLYMSPVKLENDHNAKMFVEGELLI